MTVSFLVEWALRSSVLILSGALLLRASRVKDPSIRWTAWTAILCGSLAIPLLAAALPGIPFTTSMITSFEIPVAVQDGPAMPSPVGLHADTGMDQRNLGVVGRVNWARTALRQYCAGDSGDLASRSRASLRLASMGRRKGQCRTGA